MITDPKKIQDLYQALKKEKINHLKDSSIDDVLRSLSQSIEHLKNAGFDISIDISAYPNEMSFKMVEIPSAVPISGIITLNNQEQYLFCIAREENGQKCLKLKLSMHDIRYTGTTLADEIRHHDFDFNALDKEKLWNTFQYLLLQQLSNITATKEYDVANVFNQNTAKPPPFKASASVIPPSHKNPKKNR